MISSYLGPVSQGCEKTVHLFRQGFWVALRLDLLPWLMLPVHNDIESPPSAANVATEGSTAEDVVASPALSQSREHVSFGSLITCVSGSAAVRGFALATWRGAAHHDGFVLDIGR